MELRVVTLLCLDSKFIHGNIEEAAGYAVRGFALIPNSYMATYECLLNDSNRRFALIPNSYMATWADEEEVTLDSFALIPNSYMATSR